MISSLQVDKLAATPEEEASASLAAATMSVITARSLSLPPVSTRRTPTAPPAPRTSPPLRPRPAAQSLPTI
jgi:hypothetical protein